MNPLLKLLVGNRQKGTFKGEASQNGKEDTIYLYDLLVDSEEEAQYWGGVSPMAFIRLLNSLTAATIHLRVNSPGGSVFAARAIEQALREHPSNIIAHVDGVAASAASFLICGADEIEMSPGSFLMIHKASTIVWGNCDEMMRVAGVLEQIDGSLVKTYATRTGQAPEDISTWLAEETWIDADRAVELGFADRVAETEKVKATAQAWDLSAYKNAPKAIESPVAPVADTYPQPDRAAMHRNVLRALIPA